MVAKATPLQRAQRDSQPSPLPSSLAAAADHAARLIYRVCCLAGSTNLIEEFRDADTGLPDLVSRRDTAALFDWWVGALSYQGISDRVAYEYMRRHGQVTWRALQRDMGNAPSCPKLQSYWHFNGCRYDKGSRTCAEPEHIGRCPLPRHQLRNGRLNQTAYSLYLFVRDIADGDLVGWIDNQLQQAAMANPADGLAAMREALIGPLRNVFGVSDKVLTMTLSAILISAPATWPRCARERGWACPCNWQCSRGIALRCVAWQRATVGCRQKWSSCPSILVVAIAAEARRAHMGSTA
jgi:hypothetical protein